jgi:hypothetical protein
MVITKDFRPYKTIILRPDETLRDHDRADAHGVIGVAVDTRATPRVSENRSHEWRPRRVFPVSE